MAYNMSFVDTGNTTVDIITGLNTATGGWFGGFILGMLGLIIFIAMKGYETSTVLITSGAITSLVAIFMWSVGFIGFGYIFIPIALLFAGIVVAALSK